MNLSLSLALALALALALSLSLSLSLRSYRWLKSICPIVDDLIGFVFDNQQITEAFT